MLLTSSSVAGLAFAQEPDPTSEAEASPPPGVITTAPNQTASSRDVWFQEDLAAAKARSKASRNALIGTSAAFAFGAVLMGIGASQCEWVPRFNQPEELVCNNTGDVLLPLGGTFVGLGAIGMITSGIILGVANKRKREIQRDMRRSHYGRRLQWDIPKGALVF